MTEVITMSHLTSSFNPREANRALAIEERLAVIALVFWHNGHELCLCIGRRAINPQDPWSGDLAFPGGKVEAQDQSLHHIAARETQEEIGLHLPETALIGSLGKTAATGSGQRMPMPVYPLIYHLQSTPDNFRVSDEITEAYWVPVTQLWQPYHWMQFCFPPTRQQRVGIRIGNHFLWGFSLKILVQLAERVGYPLTRLLAMGTVTNDM